MQKKQNFLGSPFRLEHQTSKALEGRQKHHSSLQGSSNIVGESRDVSQFITPDADSREPRQFFLVGSNLQAVTEANWRDTTDKHLDWTTWEISQKYLQQI